MRRPADPDAKRGEAPAYEPPAIESTCTIVEHVEESPGCVTLHLGDAFSSLSAVRREAVLSMLLERHAPPGGPVRTVFLREGERRWEISRE